MSGLAIGLSSERHCAPWSRAWLRGNLPRGFWLSRRTRLHHSRRNLRTSRISPGCAVASRSRRPSWCPRATTAARCAGPWPAAWPGTSRSRSRRPAWMRRSGRCSRGSAELAGAAGAFVAMYSYTSTIDCDPCMPAPASGGARNVLRVARASRGVARGNIILWYSMGGERLRVYSSRDHSLSRSFARYEEVLVAAARLHHRVDGFRSDHVSGSAAPPIAFPPRFRAP